MKSWHRRRGQVAWLLSLVLMTGSLVAVGNATAAQAQPVTALPGENDGGDKDATPAAKPTASDSSSATPTPSAEPTASASADPKASTSAEPTATESAKPEKSESAQPEPSTSASVSTGPKARAGGAAPQAVPAPGINSTVINVRTGGNRTGITGVTPLPGVVLGLYATAAATTPLQTCTADADGDCNFTVTNTGPGQANRNSQYYVKQISAPSGWLLNPVLRTGDGDGSGSQSTPYQFQTPPLLGGQTISSQTTSNFMLGSGSTNRVASGGIWQVSKVNPTLPTACGLDVALVLDLSGSVGTGVTQLRQAANTLVDSLQGTPSRMSLFSFSTVTPADNASQNYPSLTSVSTAAQGTAFKNRYAAWTASGGTNWDRALAAVANASDTPQLTVIITDGSPTFYGDPAEGPGNYTRLRETENGVFSANALRTQGTRVIALGVGTGVSDAATGANLAAISGPIKYNGSNSATADYYQESSYAAAGQALRNLALGNCTGSVSVTKQIVPSGNTGENITGAVPAGAGWEFNGSTSTPDIGGLPATQTTTGNGTGTVNFPLTFPGGTTSAQVSLAETQQSGYTLVTQASKNAVCTNLKTNTSVTVTNSGATGFTITAPYDGAVSCTVYNRAPQPRASITVDKQWTINGTTYANGRQPDTIAAQLLLTGPGGAAETPQGWGVTREGYTVGDTATMSETVTLPSLCTLISSSVVRNGTTPVNTLPYRATLSATTNNFTVTNVVTCQSRLTLAKEVRGGTAAPTLWNLQAVAPAGALAGPVGATGSAGATNVAVTAGVTYQLRETGGDPAYAQIDNRTNLQSNPLSTGSMTCIEIDANGVQIPGYSDGLNGGVQVPLGSRVKCTAINQTASLRLAKEVVNDNGGTAVPSDWTLTATPSGTFPVGLPTITRPGTPVDSAQFVNVRPGVAYNLAELGGPAGYQNTHLECQVDGPATDATSITLQPLQSGTCFWVNDDQPATLTLVKVVNNGTTGGTATPINWNLRAGGPVTVVGPGNSAAVTNQTVPAGSYALSEFGGPTGYTASGWSCTGGTLTGNSVTVVNGANVTCTITNTAAQPRLTLVKVVDNGTTGATTAATAWTMTAAGPSTITGATGSATVTNAAVPVGTFDLSESGPAGYTASSWVCTGGASATASSVTLALGSSATCTITNTAIAPKLTLVKQVVNQAGGTAAPTAWTLTGAGPVTISGATGSAAVTGASVRVGGYALSEAGPAGYTPSAWTCTGGTLVGSTVTLALGSDATCTITNTDQPATLTLVKVVDNGTTGGTAVPADWTLSATGPSTVTGPGNSAAVTNQTVPAGSYTLLETGGVPGYTASSWSCTGGVLVAGAVTVPNGGNVTCTITNTAIAPTLTLVKQVVNANGGTAAPTDWTLSATGPVTITGATGSTAVTTATVQVGDYDLSETGPSGYAADAWSCTGGTLSGSIVTLAAGAAATCTIVNRDQPASLTLVKVVDNGTTGATHAPSDWTLTASGAVSVTGPGNSPSVTDQSVPAGSYALSESGGPAGYTASAWTCTGGTLAGSSVTLPNGGNVTCTITNTAIAPTLTLVKQVVNANGGTAAPTDWTLSATGPVTITGATGSTAVTTATVQVGDYDLSETGPAGYTASDWDCGDATLTGSTVTVPVGQSVTCTIVNTDQPASLTLVKVVDNGDTGATAAPADWTLTASGPSTVTGPGNSPSVTDQSVPAGSYALSEAGGPAGYTASAWTCTGGTLAGSSVTLPNGGNVTCTITNTAIAPTLTLVKVVDNGDTGATTEATAWTLTADGPSTITGSTGSADVTDATAQVGTYDLSETTIAGYTASDWVCTGGSDTSATSVTLAAGDAATCTITNTAVAPTLTLVKRVVNANGGTAAPTDWTLTGAGPTTIAGATGASAITGVPVQVGDYDLSESGPTGYTASDWDCGAADLTGSTVTVPLGENVTCTIVNTDQPASLTLVKVVDNGDTGATAAPADWTLTAAGTATVTGPGNSASVTDQTVPAGSYALSEAGGPAGYTASSWTCTGGTVTGSSVAVPNGGDVTCTITNTAIVPTLTLVKVVDNGNTGATTEATAWTLTADGPNTITGATGSTAVTGAPAQVGTYELSESTIAGYSASDWVCTGGSDTSADSVTLAPGDAATCTITNTAIAPTLTLVKRVVNESGGTATPTDWTLTGAGPVTITGATGSATVTDAVVQVGDYALSEAGGPGGYTAGDWNCGAADLNGATVTVPLGQNITCTIVNTDQPAQLTLVKVVDANNSGTTKQPSDWTLTAAPQGITGQDEVSGNGDPTSAGGVNAVQVFAGDYLLSEQGPAGFDGSLWECTGGVVNGHTVTVPNGGNVTCTITNTAVAPTLTLVKQVNDPGNIGTAVPTDWTLNADGPSPISGATGDPAVTGAAVQIGSYTLSESGPADYTASDWTCVDAEQATVPVDGASITLSEGQAVTCTIVNTPVPGEWAITKSSNPVSGSTVQPGDEIVYTVTLIRGTGVAPQNVVVDDDLSNVLNNATLVSGPTASTGTATISGTAMTWTVPILDNPTETVTYTVRVNDGAWGVTLRNQATSPGSSPCVPADDGDGGDAMPGARAAVVPAAVVADVPWQDGNCPTTTDHFTPIWELTKTSDPASGSTVDPGDAITYTLTATNTSTNADLTGASATDDLSNVLNNATLASVPAGATLSGTTLTWNIPDLGPGESATLTYSVTVNSDAYDVTIGNVATPGEGGDCVTACTTDHHTPPLPPTPPLPQTGTDAALEGLLIGLGLTVAGGLVIAGARRRRKL